MSFVGLEIGNRWGSTARAVAPIRIPSPKGRSSGLLEVVCEGLWRELPLDVSVIQQSHLQTFGDVDRALSRFYENAISTASGQTSVKEDNLREWFDRTLITTRSRG